MMKHWRIDGFPVIHDHFIFAPFSITYLSYQFVVSILLGYITTDSKDLKYCYMLIIFVKFPYFMFLFPLSLTCNLSIMFIIVYCINILLLIHFLIISFFFETFYILCRSNPNTVSDTTFCNI